MILFILLPGLSSSKNCQTDVKYYAGHFRLPLFGQCHGEKDSEDCFLGTPFSTRCPSLYAIAEIISQWDATQFRSH